MDNGKALAVFEDFKIRRVYDEKAEPIKLWLAKVPPGKQPPKIENRE